MWEAGAPLQPREPAQAASAGQEERLHTDHAAPARLARRHTESSTSSSGTREPGVNIPLPPYADCFLGASITDSSHKGWRGNLQGLTTGNLMVMEKQGEAYSNKHMDLDRLSSYLQRPSGSIYQQIYSSTQQTAKSLQSCPTLCDPIDGSPPGSPVPGILQARTLKWVAISFSNA